MKGGAENRKKTIMAGAFGAAALVAVFFLYSELFGGSSTPPPSQTPVIRDETPGGGAKSSTSGGTRQTTPGGAAAGVNAEKLATTSASLDPTLDEAAMLRTESLVYSGAGRNIFSATYTPPPPPAIKALAPARPKNLPPPPPPMPPGPPPPPPINLKFFGTAKQVKQGALQAFLLSGDDVYLAGQGDIVARKYKIGTISENSVQVTDLQNNNTQTLPRQN